MSKHHELFNAYVKELHAAKDAAVGWWGQLLASEAARLGSPQQAAEDVGKRWPFGPASHPYINAVYRKYFIACEQLNEELEAAAPAANEQPDSEEDWGKDDEEVRNTDAERDDFWDTDDPIDPPVFLLELLAGRDDELAEFMAGCVFSPIGEEDGRSV